MFSSWRVHGETIHALVAATDLLRTRGLSEANPVVPRACEIAWYEGIRKPSTSVGRCGVHCEFRRLWSQVWGLVRWILFSLGCWKKYSAKLFFCGSVALFGDGVSEGLLNLQIDNPIFHRHLACQKATNTSVFIADSYLRLVQGTSTIFHLLVVWNIFFVRPIYLFGMIIPIDEQYFHMHWNHESVSAQISSRYSHIVSPLHPLYFPQ